MKGKKRVFGAGGAISSRGLQSMLSDQQLKPSLKFPDIQLPKPSDSCSKEQELSEFYQKLKNSIRLSPYYMELSESKDKGMAYFRDGPCLYQGDDIGMKLLSLLIHQLLHLHFHLFQEK
jgi:hypothetical protein